MSYLPFFFYPRLFKKINYWSKLRLFKGENILNTTKHGPHIESTKKAKNVKTKGITTDDLLRRGWIMYLGIPA